MTKIDRNFTPGGEWLYLKIYSGPMTLEQILINELYPLITQSLLSKTIDSFFFIRYTDSDYHIRLRFHSESPEKLMGLLLLLHPILDKYKKQFVISSIVVDTYCREIERYGEKHIVDVERLFFQDSILICSCLSHPKLQEQDRWLVSCVFIDNFFNQCGFSLSDKIKFCERSSHSYNLEFFGSNVSFGDKQWSKKYRNKRPEIQRALEGTFFDEDIDLLLNEFGNGTKNFTDSLCPISFEEDFQLLSSVIHMHVNRMFRTRQRLNECAIYNLLYRYYKSKKIILGQEQ